MRRTHSGQLAGVAQMAMEVGTVVAAVVAKGVRAEGAAREQPATEVTVVAQWSEYAEGSVATRHTHGTPVSARSVRRCSVQR